VLGRGEADYGVDAKYAAAFGAGVGGAVVAGWVL
jgi:hypothetical protein